MHITFIKTVKCPFPATTFLAGKTYSMPEAMAQGYLDSKDAKPAEQTPREPEPQPLAEDGEDTPDLTAD